MRLCLCNSAITRNESAVLVWTEDICQSFVTTHTDHAKVRSKCQLDVAFISTYFWKHTKYLFLPQLHLNNLVALRRAYDPDHTVDISIVHHVLTGFLLCPAVTIFLNTFFRLFRVFHKCSYLYVIITYWAHLVKPGLIFSAIDQFFFKWPKNIKSLQS